MHSSRSRPCIRHHTPRHGDHQKSPKGKQKKRRGKCRAGREGEVGGESKGRAIDVDVRKGASASIVAHDFRFPTPGFTADFWGFKPDSESRPTNFVDGLAMFTARLRGQWICQTCRKSLITNVVPRRAFRATVPRRQSVEELPPGLILRAQKMALQHQELEQKVAAMTDYTPESVLIYKRISELSDISTNLKAFEQAKKVHPPSGLF